MIVSSSLNKDQRVNFQIMRYDKPISNSKHNIRHLPFDGIPPITAVSPLSIRWIPIKKFQSCSFQFPPPFASLFNPFRASISRNFSSRASIFPLPPSDPWPKYWIYDIKAVAWWSAWWNSSSRVASFEQRFDRDVQLIRKYFIDPSNHVSTLPAFGNRAVKVELQFLTTPRFHAVWKHQCVLERI